jgi:hypothetical protein
MNRRNFVKTSAGAALLAASLSSASGMAYAAAGDADTATQDWQLPVFDLHKKIASAVSMPAKSESSRRSPSNWSIMPRTTS